MKNPIDRMKDPFYAGLMFQIESIICQVDNDAKINGLQLTDSQVRSSLIKAQKKLLGETPVIPQTNEREKILAGLITSLCLAPEALREEAGNNGEKKPLDILDWAKALEAVEDSVKTRKSDIPGSRDYLNFAQGFIRQAKGLI
ncbi:MAG: hypothetical protein WCO77_00150 [bacterium]